MINNILNFAVLPFMIFSTIGMFITNSRLNRVERIIKVIGKEFLDKEELEKKEKGEN